MTKRLSLLSLVPILGVALARPAWAQTALTAEFTYQGVVKQSGAPLNATADFQFRLFGVASGGTQIGTTQTVNNVPVADGHFTARLNDANQFGATAFNGDKRWLEIAVRSPAGGGSFTTLTPRQPLTAAPYAAFALSAPAASGPWTVSGTNIFNNNTGNVGVGATTPLAKLHVLTPASGEGLRIQGPSSTVSNTAYASFHNNSGSQIGFVGDGSIGDNTVFLSSTSHDVVLNTPAGRVLTATAGGKVGINSTNPNGGLHVVREPTTNGGTLSLEGTTHAYMAFFPDGAAAGRRGYFGFPTATTSSIYLVNEMSGGNIVLLPGAGGVVQVPVLEITGADLAEKFPTTDKVEPGMVVAIDAKNEGRLCLARGAYNRCVAGVVSGANDFKAGAILGNLPGHEDAPPIALSGRVYVWCDASDSAIQPGDLLTTSDTPGHAMKAADRERSHGAVIGKAMTALARGERGMVLVLVNLQ